MATLPAPELLTPRLMVPAAHRVVGKRRETADTWTFELEPLTPAADPGFAPGQFNMVCAGGCGEVPVSISGDPARSDRLLHTVRAAGWATRALCATEPGHVWGVRGPFGQPWPVAEAPGADIVVVAGGIGLAPLRPAVYHVLGNRERYGRLTVLYGGRAADQLLYADELLGWSQADDVDLAVTVDTADPTWRGRVGVVTKLIDRAALDPEHTVAFVCGPEVMMRFAVTALQARGIPADRIHVSLERNMQCGIGRCGHCQLGPLILCRDGPVFPYARVADLLRVREL